MICSFFYPLSIPDRSFESDRRVLMLLLRLLLLSGAASLALDVHRAGTICATFTSKLLAHHGFPCVIQPFSYPRLPLSQQRATLGPSITISHH